MFEQSKKCKTSEERSKMVRLFTKKASFRKIAKGAMVSLSLSKSMTKRNGLSRQMSCDTSNAMPCHNWGEYDEVFLEQNEPQELSHSGGFRRMQSIESEGSNKRSSYLSLSDDENSIADMNLNSFSSSRSGMGRPQIERHISHISNHSAAIRISIREEDEDETEIDEAFKQDAISKGSRGSDTSSLEDNSLHLDKELVTEMRDYNEVIFTKTKFFYLF